jgi:hypothetical protein
MPCQVLVARPPKSCSLSCSSSKRDPKISASSFPLRRDSSTIPGSKLQRSIFRFLEGTPDKSQTIAEPQVPDGRKKKGKKQAAGISLAPPGNSQEDEYPPEGPSTTPPPSLHRSNTPSLHTPPPLSLGHVYMAYSAITLADTVITHPVNCD